MTQAEMKDLNANPTADQRAQQQDAFGQLLGKLETTFVDPRAAGWAAREWDPAAAKFACPEGAECAPRLSGVELISLLYSDFPGLKGSPVDPSIESMTRHLGAYEGSGHQREETMDMLALYSAIDHQTGTSGDLPRDFAAVKEELFKTTFMTPHKSRQAVEAHSAALQEYLLFAETLRYPGYDWRPVPGVFGMRDCHVNETLVQYVPDLAARRGGAVAERRERRGLGGGRGLADRLHRRPHRPHRGPDGQQIQGHENRCSETLQRRCAALPLNQGDGRREAEPGHFQG